MYLHIDVGYTELQQRYFRLRGIVEGMRDNEIALRNRCQLFEQKLRKEQQRYDILCQNSKNELQR